MVRAVKELTRTCIWPADAASCHTEPGRAEEQPVPSGPGRTQPAGWSTPTLRQPAPLSKSFTPGCFFHALSGAAQPRFTPGSSPSAAEPSCPPWTTSARSPQQPSKPIQPSARRNLHFGLKARACCETLTSFKGNFKK